jgi:hypothetical protein
MSGNGLDWQLYSFSPQQATFCITAMKQFAAIIKYHELINSPSQHGKGPLVAGSPFVAPGYENRDNQDEADDNVNCMTQKKA